MIIEADFLDHWKTRMLVNELDDEAAPLYLIRIWAHCQNRIAHKFQNLPPEALKAICRFQGDAEKLEASLVKSGFIARDGDKLIVVGWDRHNVKLLKSRANGKKGGRPRKPKPKDNPTETQPKPNDNQNTEIHNLTKPEKSREEEIREEESRGDKRRIKSPEGENSESEFIESTNTPPRPVPLVPIPDALNTFEFNQYWQSEWIPHIAAKGKITPASVKEWLIELARYGPDKAVLILRKGVSLGWSGTDIAEWAKKSGVSINDGGLVGNSRDEELKKRFANK